MEVKVRCEEAKVGCGDGFVGWEIGRNNANFGN